MSDEDRMRSEIARMQMRGDELTDQVHANMICVKEIILFLSCLCPVFKLHKALCKPWPQMLTMVLRVLLTFVGVLQKKNSCTPQFQVRVT